VLTQIVFYFNLVWSIFKGKKVGANPWEATTLSGLRLARRRTTILPGCVFAGLLSRLVVQTKRLFGAGRTDTVNDRHTPAKCRAAAELVVVHSSVVASHGFAPPSYFEMSRQMK